MKSFATIMIFGIFASCAELADTYGDPDAVCDAAPQATTIPFVGCEPFLDGEHPLPIELGTDSPCFGAWGEALEVSRLARGGPYRTAKTRAPIIAIDDRDGPHYGEASAYAKWMLPFPTTTTAPYEVQVYLEPDPDATRGAKYKLWTSRFGSCFQTISQRVESARWVTLGVYRLGPSLSAIRVDNLTTDPNESARLQMGPVRFILVPMCTGVGGYTVSGGLRCNADVCLELALPTIPTSDFVIRMNREIARPYTVRIVDTLSDADITTRVIGTTSPCVTGANASLPLHMGLLLPATRFRIELWDGCAPEGDAPFAIFSDLMATNCDTPCAGY